jgi:hypothetical protein
MICSMRRLVLALALVALVFPVAAGALLVPGRSIPNVADVTALSVTHRSMVWAVGRSSRDCGHVRLWDTASRGLWRFGERTIRGCEEGPSGGFGIAQVATTGLRTFWVTHIGGNITDYQLWTATPTRRTPRRLVFASAETGEPAPVVLGPGTEEGVAYAVGDTVTYVSAAGARLFRTTVGSPVRLVTAGTTFGLGRVLVSLADGRMVLLSSAGAVVATETFEPDAVRAIALAYTGPVVQVGTDVRFRQPDGRAGAVTLPGGALMLDYRQRGIFYRQGTQVRVRGVGTGADTLLLVVPLRPSQPMLFSHDLGTGWAVRATVDWRA